MNTIPMLNAERLLRANGLRADKSLAQNFLQDPLALKLVTEAAEIQRTDSVMEIGAGLGSLTRYLSISAREVVAVELDQKLVPILRTVLKPYSNVRVVLGNILALSPGELGLPADYIVAANIPYNITSAIIRHLLESQPKPRRIVLTVQKEVAARICSTPPEMSILALSVQVYGDPTVVAQIPAMAFFPAPKVDSAIVRIEIDANPLIPPSLLPAFFKLIKSGFGQKRKTLRNSLSAGLHASTLQIEALLRQANIDPRRRAETLNLDEWHILSALWAKRAPATTG